MRIGKTIAEANEIIGYIPVISTPLSFVDLFLKVVVIRCLSEKTVENSRYWSYIDQKEYKGCLARLIPVIGNIIAGIMDYSDYKEAKAFYAFGKKQNEATKTFTEDMAAMTASRISGKPVSGADMRPAANLDQQALWVACFNNDMTNLQKLLDKGTSPNFYHSGSTPLTTACRFGSSEIVSLLLQKGADPLLADRYGNTPLMTACGTVGKLDNVKALRPYIKNIDETNHKGCTPLMVSVCVGDQTTVAYLMEQGADSRKLDNTQMDAVAYAILFYRIESLPLLKEDEDIEERTYEFNAGLFSKYSSLSPLLLATLCGKVDSALYLLDRSNLERKDSDGCTVLHRSVRHIEILKAVLEKGADNFINDSDRYGYTALHRAANLGLSEEAALLLIQHGADPRIGETDPTKSVLVLAAKNGLANLVDTILRDYGNTIPQEIKQLAQDELKKATPPKQPVEKSDVPQTPTPLSSAMDTLLDAYKKQREEVAREQKLGPRPRMAMEFFLGRIDKA